MKLSICKIFAQESVLRRVTFEIRNTILLILYPEFILKVNLVCMVFFQAIKMTHSSVLMLFYHNSNAKELFGEIMTSLTFSCSLCCSQPFCIHSDFEIK